MSGRELYEKGLCVQIRNGLSIRQIMQDGEGRFRVLGRRVKLSDPSPPYEQSVRFEPDCSRYYEDSMSADKAISLLVLLCAKRNLRAIGKNTGFVVWQSERNEVAEHLPGRDDYVAISDVHNAGIQFFRYRFEEK